MFRICDKGTGEVLFQTDNIQELSDYLVDKEMMYLTAQAAEEWIK